MMAHRRLRFDYEKSFYIFLILGEISGFERVRMEMVYGFLFIYKKRSNSGGTRIPSWTRIQIQAAASFLTLVVLVPSVLILRRFLIY